jgi:hypothetical protein
VKGDDSGWAGGGQCRPRDLGSALWLVVGAVGAHIIEEYALNFVGWSHQALRAPISWEDFHVVNAGVIVYCAACAAIGGRMPAVALSSAALVVLNAIGFHAGASLLTQSYSPGTVSAVLLFVPSGVFAFTVARRAGLLTARVLTLSIGLGLLWHGFLAAVFAIKYFAPLYR